MKPIQQDEPAEDTQETPNLESRIQVHVLCLVYLQTSMVCEDRVLGPTYMENTKKNDRCFLLSKSSAEMKASVEIPSKCCKSVSRHFLQFIVNNIGIYVMGLLFWFNSLPFIKKNWSPSLPTLCFHYYSYITHFKIMTTHQNRQSWLHFTPSHV